VVVPVTGASAGGVVILRFGGSSVSRQSLPAPRPRPASPGFVSLVHHSRTVIWSRQD
jgi:hypothetical protein